MGSGKYYRDLEALLESGNHHWSLDSVTGDIIKVESEKYTSGTGK